MLVVALLCACAWTSDAKQCIVKVEEGNGRMYAYDLSSLGELSVEMDGLFFTLNLCDGVSKGCSSDTAVCVSDSENKTYTNFGKVTTKPTKPQSSDSPGQGVIFDLVGEDGCGEDGYSSVVIVSCSPDGDTRVLNMDHRECSCFLDILSKYGCGVPAVDSSGSGRNNGGSSSVKVAIASMIATTLLLLLAHF